MRKLLLSPTQLVMLSSPQPDDETPDWTIYSLQVPTHLALYTDMITVADMNVGAPHGHLQLLCEAHMVVRTWLHRLSWLQVSGHLFMS